MVMAVLCFGDHRREWALAMQAEFEVAADEGEPLKFALGCLAGALREMPFHEEGRFALSNHLLSVGVVIPMAVLLLASVVLGHPFLALDETGAGGIMLSGTPTFPIVPANRPGLQQMTGITFALGLGHLYMAWAMLDRDWTRVAVAGRFGASAMITIVIFTGVLFLDDTCALPQAVAIAIELTAIWSLVRWHADLPDAASHANLNPAHTD
jgi:hypothetical protein